MGIDKNYFESISKEDFNNIDKNELNGFLDGTVSQKSMMQTKLKI